MVEELQRAEAMVEAGPVRPLPVLRERGTIELWGRQVGPLAVAATAGAAAGVAAVAVARAGRMERRPPQARSLPPTGADHRRPQLPG